MNHNWYLATENEEKEFRWLRLSFIRKINYAVGGKVTYQSSRAEHYTSFFTSLQNAMTLANVSFQKAILKASPNIALYFNENMKPFFPSQEYIRTEADGSIVFSIEYTQPLEILPFLKQWQPDITILSPQRLIDELITDMKKSLEIHTN